jgi:hypothetical protein
MPSTSLADSRCLLKWLRWKSIDRLEFECLIRLRGKDVFASLGVVNWRSEVASGVTRGRLAKGIMCAYGSRIVKSEVRNDSGRGFACHYDKWLKRVLPNGITYQVSWEFEPCRGESDKRASSARESD